MKYEILKKTLLYRLLSFGLSTFLTTLLLWGDPWKSFEITIWTEIGAVCLYYVYEFFWRKYVERKRLKEGDSVLCMNGDSKVRIAYEVIEDLGEGKLIIEIV